MSRSLIAPIKIYENPYATSAIFCIYSTEIIAVSTCNYNDMRKQDSKESSNIAAIDLWLDGEINDEELKELVQ